MHPDVPNQEQACLTGDAIDRHEPDRDVEIHGDDHVQHRRGEHQAGRNETEDDGDVRCPRPADSGSSVLAFSITTPTRT
jgi:hypothetical protein